MAQLLTRASWWPVDKVILTYFSGIMLLELFVAHPELGALAIGALRKALEPADK